MNRLAILAALALTACATTNPCPPAADKVSIQRVNIPIPVACVNKSDIPAEPAKVGDRVNGNAAHDLLLVAPEAIDLRIALEKSLLLLDGCAKG